MVLGHPSIRQSMTPGLRRRICTFTISGERPQPSSILLDSRFVSSPKSSLGAKIRLSASSTDTWLAELQSRKQSGSSTRPEREHNRVKLGVKLWAQLQLSNGAGEGNRTLDIQLGKLDVSQQYPADSFKTGRKPTYRGQWVRAGLQNRAHPELDRAVSAGDSHSGHVALPMQRHRHLRRAAVGQPPRES